MSDIADTVRERQRRELIDDAAAAHAAWRAFDGRWESWRLGRMKERVYRFGSTFADRGDAVLIDPESAPGTLTIYTPKLRLEIAVRPEKVEAL